MKVPFYNTVAQDALNVLQQKSNIAIKESWNTDNSITTSMIVKDRFVPGLTLKGDYKQWVHSRIDNWLLGCQVGIDLPTMNMTNTNIMLGYKSALKLGVYSKFKFSNFLDSQQQIGFGISYEQPHSCC
ncbi:voltage-dependent anion-selective channel [Trichinella spiralis]|uniref:voltage-dependent anion-selective channel n=1 Tax=Trichinella spiralis TaxID=6334 RepID=UPI0001EFBDF0|nr:voltage-dependent anion-selective channel [Trichinella spiralis]